MGQPIAKLDFSKTPADFRRLASEPGFPVIDASHVNDKVVGRWLGRFAASPECRANEVHFYLRNDSGNRVEDVACKPATAAELAGPLRKELRELQQQLEQAVPTGKAEQGIQRLLSDQFRALTSQSQRTDPHAQFFQYEDERGRRRLVWCWGYQRADAAPTGAVVCAQCRQLFLNKPEREGKCPSCGTPVPVKRFPWLKLALFVLGLILLGGSGYSAYWYVQPRCVLEGQIVRDGDEQPVAGAEIRVVDGASQTTLTADDGMYRLDQLPAGSIRFEVDAPGYPVQTTDHEFAPGEHWSWRPVLTGDAVVAGRVLNAHGELPVPNAEVEIVGSPWRTHTDQKGVFEFTAVRRGAAELRAKATGFPDSIAKIDAGGESSTNVAVKLTGAARLVGQVLSANGETPISEARVAMELAGLETKTNAEGWFAFKNAPDGLVNIKIQAESYKENEVSRELVSGQERSLRVLLNGGAVVVGQVLNEKGREPLNNAEVRVVGTRLFAKSGKDGRFVLPGVRVGNIRLEVTADGFRPQTLSVDAQDGKETYAQVVLRGGAVIVGKVTDSDGAAPVPEAEISIRGTTMRAVTDSKGEFRLTDAPSMRMKIDISAKGFKTTTIDQKVEEGVETMLDVVLKGEMVVVGRVVDAATDEPVADARVTIENRSSNAATADDGQFRLEGLRGGTVRVRIAAKGFAEQTVQQTIGSANPSPLVVKLKGDATVAGSVVHLLTGKPVEGAQVTIVGTKLSQVTAPDGTFQFPDLRGGLQKVNASAAGFRDRKVDIQLNSGRTANCQIELGGEAVLTGEVVDTITSAKIPRTMIRLSGTSLTAESDGEGKFRIENAFGGDVEVEAAASGYAPNRISQKLAQQGDTTVRITLEGAGEAAGQVLDTEGRAISGASVRAAVSGHQTSTDNVGRFVLRKCPAGAVELVINAKGFESFSAKQQLKESGQTVLPTIRLSSNTSFSGRIVNAINGSALSGAQITIPGSGIAGASDTDGKFSLQRVPVGGFQLKIDAEGFNSEQVGVNSASDNESFEMVLNPLLAPGEARFVLTWGAKIPDLDAHLLRAQTESSKFHVFHKLRKAEGATLDVDNRNGRGPETITIRNAVPGRYEYWVHLYQDPKIAQDHPQTLDRSAATLRVFTYGNKQAIVLRVSADDQEARHAAWHPCGILVDEGGKMEIIPYKRNVFKDELPN